MGVGGRGGGLCLKDGGVGVGGCGEGGGGLLLCRSRSQRRQYRGVDHHCPRSPYCQKTRAVFTVLSENTGSLHCVVRKHGQSSMYCQKTRAVFTLLSENTGSLHCIVRKHRQSSLYYQKTQAVFTVLSENTGSLHCIVRKHRQSYCIVRKHGQSLLYCQKTRAVFTVLSENTGSLLSENTGSLHCIIRKKRAVFTVLSENAGSPEDLVAEKCVVCRSRGVSLAVCWTIRVPDGSVQRTTSLVSGSPKESQAMARTPGGRQLGPVCTERCTVDPFVLAECAPCKEKKNGG